jgi:hypothetical protein
LTGKEEGSFWGCRNILFHDTGGAVFIQACIWSEIQRLKTFAFAVYNLSLTILKEFNFAFKCAISLK